MGWGCWCQCGHGCGRLGVCVCVCPCMRSCVCLCMPPRARGCPRARTHEGERCASCTAGGQLEGARELERERERESHREREREREIELPWAQLGSALPLGRGRRDKASRAASKGRRSQEYRDNPHHPKINYTPGRLLVGGILAGRRVLQARPGRGRPPWPRGAGGPVGGGLGRELEARSNIMIQ